MNSFGAYRAQLVAEGSEHVVLGVPVSNQGHAARISHALRQLSPEGVIDAKPVKDGKPTVMNGNWVAGVIREGVDEGTIKFYLGTCGVHVEELGPEQPAYAVDLEAFLGHAGVEALTEYAVHVPGHEPSAG
jgi:hypothetical protein